MLCLKKKEEEQLQREPQVFFCSRRSSHWVMFAEGDEGGFAEIPAVSGRRDRELGHRLAPQEQSQAGKS